MNTKELMAKMEAGDPLADNELERLIDSIGVAYTALESLGRPEYRLIETDLLRKSERLLSYRAARRKV